MTYKHILVPVDESPISYAAVEQALALAKKAEPRVAQKSQPGLAFSRTRTNARPRAWLLDRSMSDTATSPPCGEHSQPALQQF